MKYNFYFRTCTLYQPWIDHQIYIWWSIWLPANICWQLDWQRNSISLLSLMVDQVTLLRSNGLNICYINSCAPQEDRDVVIHNLLLDQPPFKKYIEVHCSRRMPLYWFVGSWLSPSLCQPCYPNKSEVSSDCYDSNVHITYWAEYNQCTHGKAKLWRPKHFPFCEEKKGDGKDQVANTILESHTKTMWHCLLLAAK